MVGMGGDAADPRDVHLVAGDDDRSLRDPRARAQLAALAKSDQGVRVWVEVGPAKVTAQSPLVRRMRRPEEAFPLFDVVGLEFAVQTHFDNHRDQLTGVRARFPSGHMCGE